MVRNDLNQLQGLALGACCNLLNQKEQKRGLKMKATHDYAARIDHDLWMDCLKVKELDAATTSINSMVNEGLKMVRDRKMQEITAQRKRRNSLQSMVNW